MTKSALRVLDIMEFIAGEKSGCTHTHLAQKLGIPKSSLTALLRDLVSREFLLFDADTGRYAIGPHILSLSHAYLRNLNIVQAAQPLVSDLFRKTGEYSAFAIPKGTDYVVICAESAPMPLAHSLQIGERGRMFCSATGKAILAFYPPEQRDAVLAASDLAPVTSATVTDPARIRAELAEVARTRIAFAREESIPGITAVAAPVFNSLGTVVGAVSVATPSSRFSPAQATIVAALREAADELCARLGWRTAA